MIYIPIKETLISLNRLKSFQSFLDEIKKDFDKYNNLQESFTPVSILKSFRDGEFCRGHPIFSKQLSIPITFYFDDLELANPLGSRSSIHKITAIYFTLPDMPESCRSKLESIFLLGMVKSSTVKKNWIGLYSSIIL